MNKSFPKIKIIITAALVFLPINISWAQHCDPSWTAEYSCMEGCGHCPSGSSSSASAAPQVDNQVGMMGAQMLGQGIAQMILGNQQEAVDARNEALNLNNQGLQYFNNGQWQLAANDFIAALQKSNDPIIQKNLGMAQQKLAEQGQMEMQVAIDQKNQEIHDRLSSEMKSDDGTGYGIPGLPGIYVNGPRQGESGLQLMKDDDASSANVNSNAIANNNRETSNDPPVVQASGALQSEGGLQLMKDDDVPSNAPFDNPTGQKTAGISGVPIKDAHLETEQVGNGNPDFDGSKAGNVPIGKVNLNLEQSVSDSVEMQSKAQVKLPVADEVPENETYWKDRYPLDDQRGVLMSSHDSLNELIAAHQAKCSHPDASCAGELKSIETKVSSYQNDLKIFNNKVSAAVSEVDKNERHLTLDEMKYDDEKMNPKHDPDIQKGIDQRRIQACVDLTGGRLSAEGRTVQEADIIKRCKESRGRAGLPPIDANGIRG